jgi:hypothetical protein
VQDTLGLDGLNQDAAHVKIVVFPAFEGFFVCDYPAPVVLETPMDFVVVTMLMGD